MYIYRILNKINGKCYIGQSVQNNNKRLNQHRYKLNKGIHPNHHLQSAWNFYGEPAFLFEKLMFVDDEIILDTMEKQYIKEYNSDDRNFGYNIFDGGHHQHTVPYEVREKIGKANTGNFHTEEQKNKWAKEKRTNNYSDKIVSPTDEIYTVSNVREFCRTHDLDKANLMRVLKGISYHTKGWRLPETPKEFCDTRYVTFYKQSKIRGKKIKSPSGKVYIINKPLSIFCEEHNILKNKIRSVLNGTLKQHRGWTQTE